MDLSPRFIELARAKFPDRCYYQLDILDQPESKLPVFDYIVLNGVLTEKRELSFDEMWDYTRRLLSAVMAKSAGRHRLQRHVATSGLGAR